MKITFYAHACFRLEDEHLSVITDPYTPGPEGSRFDPVNEPADIVIMSSATDSFHSNPNHISGEPTIVDAMTIPPEGLTVTGLHILSFNTMESLSHDYGRDPDANAMYLFELGGVRVLHMGDVGNAIDDKYLHALRGKVDVLFALTGGQPTIALDDLDAAINGIEPRVVIPMHYYSPRGVLKILSVTDFTDRYPKAQVTCVGGPELTLTPETLPETLHIYVLEQSR